MVTSLNKNKARAFFNYFSAMFRFILYYIKEMRWYRDLYYYFFKGERPNGEKEAFFYFYPIVDYKIYSVDCAGKTCTKAFN